MALSGTVTKNVGSYWKLVLEWTATQNKTANTSTIASKLYWQSTSSYGSVSSSASKSYEISIGSSTHSGTFTAGLSGVQKKQIGSYTRTVSHNSSGNLDITLKLEATLGLNLGGNYYGTQTGSKEFSLNNIPQESYARLKALPEWEIQRNLPVSWTKDTSTDTHRLRVYVGSMGEPTTADSKVYVAMRENLEDSSRVITFGDTELERIIAERIDGGTANYWVELTTYDKNGNNKGSHTLSARVVTPGRNTIIPDYENGYEVGEDFNLPITRLSSLWNTYVYIEYLDESEVIFSYDEEFEGKVNTVKGFVNEKYLPVGQRSMKVRLGIGSYITLNGTTYQVRSGNITKEITIKRTVRTPVWSTTTVPKVIDTNSTTVALTGNNLYLIQNLSNLRINIPIGAAIAQDGALISKYDVYKGSTKIGSYNASTTQVDLGIWNVQGSQRIVIHAIDNYGGSASKEIFIGLIPYSKPAITSNNIERLNGYEGTILGAISGSYSPILISGVAKNSLNSVVLKYKVSTDSSYTTLGNYNITHTPNRSYFTTNSLSILGLSESLSYDVQIITTDRIGNSFTYNKTVGPGIPLMYLDKKAKSVGFGKFPTRTNTVETPYQIYAGNNNLVFNEGNLIIRSGEVSITPVGGVATKASISFGKNGFAFPGKPEVLTQCSTTVPGVSVLGHSAAAITTTGCDIYITRTNTTSTTVKWTAIWREGLFEQ